FTAANGNVGNYLQALRWRADTTNKVKPLHQIAAQKNEANDEQQRDRGFAEQCQRIDRGTAERGGSVHQRLSFWMRSDGVMISVIRMPYLSSTTTTTPCAIR